MIYLALGSNLSGAFASSEALMAAAMTRLSQARMRVHARSPLYQTRPIGPAGQAAYVNAVVAVSSNLAPLGLLAECHAIEAEFGRYRRVKWGPRTLDIDILDYRQQICHHRIDLPHPRLAQRGFVLQPLRQIAPAWRHPVSGRHIEQLLADLPIGELNSVKRLKC
jgi:2-amino-4-hydroxy-6-hydroxymethyldihydropteridine diphosphokinase